MQKKDFTGVWIPKEIIENKNLSGDEKMLYADIACFNECYILNKTFAERYGVSERTIQNRIKKLKDEGFVAETAFSGRKRTLKTTLSFRGRHEKSFVAEVKDSSPIDNNIDNNINNTPRTPQRGEQSNDSSQITQAVSVWNDFKTPAGISGCWQNKKVRTSGKLLPGCRKETPKIKELWKKLAKNYDMTEFEHAVKQYVIDILHRDSDSGSYHAHRFSFEEFLKRDGGFKKFVNLEEKL